MDNLIVLIYVVVWLMTTASLVDSNNIFELLVAAIVALFWPIVIPMIILRKLMH